MSATYEFGNFRLEVASASLHQDGREIDLAPRAFQVLVFLVENRSRVASKQELIEAIWKETFVTDDALVQAVTAVRRALGDEPDQPRFIRTKPRIGYQFIAEVREPETSTGPEGTGASPEIPVWVAPVSRPLARRMFLLIQIGYLIIYGVALAQIERGSESLGSILDRMVGRGDLALPIILTLALIGSAVRLYLGAAVVLDHPQTGRQFRRLFPFLFVLDELWAASPLLMLEDYGLPAVLVLVPVLAYAPFSQITLVRSAYGAGNAAGQVRASSASDVS